MITHRTRATLLQLESDARQRAARFSRWWYFGMFKYECQEWLSLADKYHKLSEACR